MIHKEKALQQEGHSTKHSVIGFISVFILTSLAFIMALQFEFISYDDPAYITENSYVNSGVSAPNTKWALTSTGKTNLWHPVTFMSHQLDVELFGLNPKWHHAVNIFLHAIAAGLLYLVSSRLAKSHLLGIFIALIWAIHPEKIQSVVWLSERKDVLSGAFFFASIYSFMKWGINLHWSLYLLSLSLFTVALMSKPSVVTLPLVLFVLFYMKKNVIRSAFRSLPILLPFYIASGVTAAIAIYFQSIGDLGNVSDHLSLSQKAMNTSLSFTFYLERFVWPHPSQLWFYPPSSSSDYIISLVIILLVAILLFWLSMKERLIAIGIATYTILWLPVSGIVTVGYYFRADRYSYLPMLGLVFILVGLVKYITRSERNFLPSTTLLTLITAGFITMQQIQLPIWKNDESLFSNEMKVNPRSLLAPIHYGKIYEESDPEKALRYFKKAHALNTESGLALMNMGITQKKLGLYNDALDSFTKGTKVKIPITEIWSRLMILQAEQKLNQQAEATIKLGLEKFPNEWTLIVNSASYYINKQDRSPEELSIALKLFTKAHRMKPSDPDANLGCAAAYMDLGKLEEAKKHYRLLPSEQQNHPAIQRILNQ